MGAFPLNIASGDLTRHLEENCHEVIIKKTTCAFSEEKEEVKLQGHNVVVKLFIFAVCPQGSADIDTAFIRLSITKMKIPNTEENTDENEFKIRMRVLSRGRN